MVGQTISINLQEHILLLLPMEIIVPLQQMFYEQYPSATINSVTTTSLTCKNSGNGSAVCFCLGGVGTLTYLWSNGGTGATITNVASGHI